MSHVQDNQGDKGVSISLKVIDGTPQHSEKNSLCFRCRNAHVKKGMQASDLTIHCLVSYENPVPIRKPIVECTEFSERTGQTRKEMEKIAWILETKRGRPIGFFNPLDHKWRAKSGEVDDEDDD